MPLKGNYYYHAFNQKIPGVRTTKFYYSFTDPTGGYFQLSGESLAVWDGRIATRTLRFLYR